MPEFSRANPSPRYLQLQALYSRLHGEGERTLGIAPQDTFPGKSLFPHVERIRRLIEETGARTILDYGAGKGQQYAPKALRIEGRAPTSVAQLWAVDEIRCYDPGYPAHSELPSALFDGVVSTDVLEHCPESDLPWILGEIFSFARRFVYLNVACFPARKTLPNGENAHITVRPPEWWRELVARIASAHPGVRWQLVASHVADAKLAEAVFGSEQGNTDVTEIAIEGRTARFATPNEMTRWRAKSLYRKEPSTIAWLLAMRPGATFLDVGANVGMYSVFAALARRAAVFAFEPEAQNYALLNSNIALNGLEGQVIAVCAGLSDKAALDRLYLAVNQAGTSCHSLGAQVGFDLRPRPAAFVQGALSLRLDDLISSGELPVPEYIKIDVDGFEHKVVAGARATLARPEVRGLCVEVNHNLEAHLDLVDELGVLGFRHDPAQVARAERKEGAFKGVAEYVFSR